MIGQRLLELISGPENSGSTRAELFDFEAGNFQRDIKPGTTMKRSASWLELHNRAKVELLAKSIPHQKNFVKNEFCSNFAELQQKIEILHEFKPKFKKSLEEYKVRLIFVLFFLTHSSKNQFQVLMRLDENELCNILLDESDPLILLLTMEEFFQFFEAS